MLSEEVKIRLKEFNWEGINTATLHPLDIQRLYEHFRSILNDGLDYDIDCFEKWLNTFFLGLDRVVKSHIFDIAREVRISHS